MRASRREKKQTEFFHFNGKDVNGKDIEATDSEESENEVVEKPQPKLKATKITKLKSSILEQRFNEDEEYVIATNKSNNENVKAKAKDKTTKSKSLSIFGKLNSFILFN
jgi:hypothetical protein